MTSLLLVLAGFLGLACWLTWLCEHALDADAFDDVTALAEAAGVMATREQLRQDALNEAHLRAWETEMERTR